MASIIPATSMTASSWASKGRWPKPYADIGINVLRGIQLTGAESFQTQHVVPGHPSSPQHLGVTPPSCTPLDLLIGTASIHQHANREFEDARVGSTALIAELGAAVADPAAAGPSGRF